MQQKFEYAYPCGGCWCEKCVNNVENKYTTAKEMREPCFNCDHCRNYDGDPVKQEVYRSGCENYAADQYHVTQAHKHLKEKNRRKRNEEIIRYS